MSFAVSETRGTTDAPYVSLKETEKRREEGTGKDMPQPLLLLLASLGEPSGLWVYSQPWLAFWQLIGKQAFP